MLKQDKLLQNTQPKVTKPRQSRQPLQQSHQQQQSIQNINQNIVNNQQPRIPMNRQQSARKVSHKVKNKQELVGNNSNMNGIKKNRPMATKSQKVSFNLKNNHVEKFYCPQLIVNKLNKPQEIDLELIPDLPEIPLDSLIGTH